MEALVVSSAAWEVSVPYFQSFHFNHGLWEPPSPLLGAVVPVRVGATLHTRPRGHVNPNSPCAREPRGIPSAAQWVPAAGTGVSAPSLGSGQTLSLAQMLCCDPWAPQEPWGSERKSPGGRQAVPGGWGGRLLWGLPCADS